MNKVNKYGYLNALIGMINTYDEDDSKVVIAKYLLEHFDHVHKLNIFDVADECFVTRASIRRFSKHIGFDNFRDLKSDLEPYQFYHAINEVNDYPQHLANEITMMANDCNECLHQQISDILQYMKSCKTIIFLVSDIYSTRCVEFQKEMILAGKMVRIVSHNFTENKLLKHISQDDLLITISVTAGFAQHINSFVKEFQCKKAIITTSQEPLFKELYDLVLQLGRSELPQTKTIYHMFAVEYYLDIIAHEYHKLYR